VEESEIEGYVKVDNWKWEQGRYR